MQILNLKTVGVWSFTYSIKISIIFSNSFHNQKLTIKTVLIHISNWIRRLSGGLATHVKIQNINQNQNENDKRKHVTNTKLNHESNYLKENKTINENRFLIKN